MQETMKNPSLADRAQPLLEAQNFDALMQLAVEALSQNPRNAQAHVLALMAERKVTALKALGECDSPLERSEHYTAAYDCADDATRHRLKSLNESSLIHYEKDVCEPLYHSGKFFMEHREITDRYARAEAYFSQIRDYKDANELYLLCHNRSEVSQEGLAERGAGGRKLGTVIAVIVGGVITLAVGTLLVVSITGVI